MPGRRPIGPAPRRSSGRLRQPLLLLALPLLIAMASRRALLAAAFTKPPAAAASNACWMRSRATAATTAAAVAAERWVRPTRLSPGWRLYSTAPEPVHASAAAPVEAPAAHDDQQQQGEQPPAAAANRTSRRRKSKEWQGPLAYHQELTLRVESLTNLGMGVCRVDLGEEGLERWVVMVPAVVPGEMVRVKVFRNHKNYSEADLLEVLEPSSDRVEPTCPLFGRCGGCQYQHMSVGAQRAWKRQHVGEVLRRTGNISESALVPVNEVFGTAQVLGYRSKITPHHEKPRNGEIRDIGFLRLGSRSLVDVERCEIATPAINERLSTLRQEVRAKARQTFEEGSPKKAKGATLFLRQTNEGVVTDTRTEVSETVNGLTFQFTAGSFFQNNPFVLPHMVEYVADKARAAPGLRFLVDAYCGGGLFCLSASRHFESCYGVEISELAVLSARRNAELNGIENCHFRAGDAADIFAGISHLPGKETVVIIDPPRKGCDADFLEQLFAFRPARVVYVSCDPATQARDARAFVDSGYAIEEIQPFDLFPMTRHVENVIVFRDTRLLGMGLMGTGQGQAPPAPATAAE